jgi:hypothetical protein
MTPVTKQAWIDALRSGEFNQCTGALGKLDPDTGTMSYCCLGVLATLAGVKHRLESDPMVPGGSKIFDFGEEEFSLGVIPESFRSIIVSDLDLAQDIKGPANTRDDLMRVLSSKNDRGASFNQIADYLETLP